ncbi:hypothetical protein [Prauserella flavalba]|nr:hypothetical protein [Prauserella flavalba]
MNDTKDTVADVTWIQEQADEALAAIAALHETATKAVLGEQRTETRPQ